MHHERNNSCIDRGRAGGGAAGPTFSLNNTSPEGSRLLGEDVLMPEARETRET